ncbi:ParB N-terminal domain-containing protein [Clostridium luticellarii]|uniref:ParB-like nuclease domain protein n=1 Tax=Clostridium luticellarii TaxID=1691940 RepID=A0A2T0BNQ0_9CLOT|nr:ParB N-terminal domain-containing protein [Clostridium luticellarii]PRR85509.1 ParB-like nuclease domain protein [Clostridium luticellarii]
MREIKTSLGIFKIPDTPTIKTKKGVLKLPVMAPILVPTELVQANNYNPNHVDDNNMRLLETSILENGFTFAIVTVWDPDIEKFVIVDGFHREEILKFWLECEEIPIVVLEQDIAQRLAATVQFNRARGVHQVDLMGDLVKSLFEQGQDDQEIAKQLGMEPEEVFRLKQITGIAELFKNQKYSKAWEMHEVNENV